MCQFLGSEEERRVIKAEAVHSKEFREEEAVEADPRWVGPGHLMYGQPSG